MTASTVSLSDMPCNACNAITLAMTSAGTLGRPRPLGNKSANISSVNSSARCAAKNAKRRPPSEDAPQPTPHPTTHAEHPTDRAHQKHREKTPQTGRPPRGIIQSLLDRSSPGVLTCWGVDLGFSWITLMFSPGLRRSASGLSVNVICYVVRTQRVDLIY